MQSKNDGPPQQSFVETKQHRSINFDRSVDDPDVRVLVVHDLTKKEDQIKKVTTKKSKGRDSI